MAARCLWCCPWCSGQLGLSNVKLTLKNRFPCPHCRNKLRLQPVPLLLAVALVWSLFDVPVILYHWEPQANEPMLALLFVAVVLDLFIFYALLAPLFVRAAP